MDDKDQGQEPVELSDAALSAAAGGASDSMSALGDQQSLRMQLYMDQQAKAMQALSNAQKKSTDTTNAIIGNLK